MPRYIAYCADGKNLFFNTRLEIGDYFKLTNGGITEAIKSGCAVYRYGEKIPFYIDLLKGGAESGRD